METMTNKQRGHASCLLINAPMVIQFGAFCVEGNENDTFSRVDLEIAVPVILRQDRDILELVRRVDQAARVVYSELGPGYDEKVYRLALAAEFRERKIKFEEEKSAEVRYKGHRVGFKFIDFLVEGRLAVELKAKVNLGQPDEAQAVASGETVERPSLLINFPDVPRENKDKIVVINAGGQIGDGGPQIRFRDRRVAATGVRA